MSKIDKKNDGGYYAIKGFEFQIDKTILEILNLKDINSSVNIENIQDLDSDDFVMQIKYRETQNYTDIEIREPVVQLIEEFIINPSKKYKLYCHFNLKNDGVEVLDINRLNSILTLINGKTKYAERINNKIGSFSDVIKMDFIKNFELIFAPEHEIQLENLLSKISEELNINIDDSIFHHGNLSNYLRQKALTDKNCTKKELLSYITTGRSLIFTSDFRKHQGSEKYFKFIKNKYFSSLNIDNHERFFILELFGDESVSDIKTEILNIKNKFYKKYGGITKKIIKSGSPYIYLKNIECEKLKNLKSELLNESYCLKDGHDFLNAEFKIESIKEPSTIYNDICLKFINTEDNLNMLLEEKFNKTKEVYQFFISKPLYIKQDVKNIKIQISNLSEISLII